MTSSDVVMQVPYYNQGASENCWSMSLTMLLAAYGAQIEPWDNNRFFELKAEHGLPYWGFVHASGIVTHIRSFLPSANVERLSWWDLDGSDDLREYLRRNMRARRPTMVYYFADEAGNPAPHMVLFVGLEGEAFVIHDPQANEAYVRRTWDRIAPRFRVTGFDGAGTLALLEPIPEPTSDATIMVPYARTQNDGISLVRRVDGRFDPNSVRVFTWYVPSAGGPAFADVRGVRDNPSLDHLATWSVTVANTVAGGPRRTLQVGFDITRGAVEEVVYEHPPIATELAGGHFADVDLLSFAEGRRVRDLVSEMGTYNVELYVAEGERRLDTATIQMIVGPSEGCGYDPEVRYGGTMTGTTSHGPFTLPGPGCPAGDGACEPILRLYPEWGSPQIPSIEIGMPLGLSPQNGVLQISGSDFGRTSFAAAVPPHAR